MVRWSICECSALQSAVCLSNCLAAAPVFLLGATRHFVLLSCKICAEIVVYRMLAVFLNGLNGKNSSRSIVRNIFFRFKISYSEFFFCHTDCYLRNQDCKLHKWTACAVHLLDLWMNKFWPVRYLLATHLILCTMIVRWRNSLSALLLF